MKPETAAFLRKAQEFLSKANGMLDNGSSASATLIVVGAVIGAAQFCIYIRQAEIMSTQAQIAKAQLAEMQLEGELGSRLNRLLGR
jgi:flavin-binding protein dodecin